jgi:CheY-like chemotaxis protein
MTIHLPRTLEEAHIAPPPVVAAPARGTETVLVAEDEAGLRALAVRILQSAGYTTLVAANGEEAVRLLERQDSPVHLLLTDVVMPGMSGPVLAERLQASHPGLKVLYTSGHADEAIVQQGILAEGVHFIGKPYTGAGLMRKVREVLDARR